MPNGLAKRLGWAAALLLAGCVYPAGEPTGVEFTWRFTEANTVDGDEAVRARTCAGANIDVVAMDISDDDARHRQGIFRFPCDEGFQTPIQFQTEASEAFVELQPGLYTVRALAVDPDATFSDAELIEERPIDIAERQVQTQVWEIARELAPLTLTLSGATDCSDVGFALYYDDPEAQLTDYEADDDASLLLYREALTSEDGALSFDGTSVPCDDALNATHVIPDLDRGTYLVEVTVDQTACALRVTVDAQGAALPLDLAQLPCGG